ncbi:MAG: DUF7260 family protein [Halapricum sp.]
MTEIRQPHIGNALERVDAERDVLEAERDAFQALLRRVGEIGVDSQGTIARPGATTAAVTVRSTTGSRRLRRIREAYRETVMAVPHYEDEYGESLRTNLTAEFGEEVAGHVVGGDVLTPRIHGAFTQICKQARDDRKRVLQRIERERERLVSFDADLTTIERDVVDAGAEITPETGTRRLSSIDDTLAALRSRCLDLVAERRKQVHARKEMEIPGAEGFGLHEYLYAGTETPAPVLADIAACLGTIRSHRIRGFQADTGRYGRRSGNDR